MNQPQHFPSTGVHCRFCGYDLTGATIGSTCPECGSPVSPAFQGASAPTSGKAIASMVLGIVSIVTCMFYGVPGLICGILAIIYYRLAQQQIREGTVGSGSVGMAKAGLITGIVGIALSLLMFAYIVGVIIWIVMSGP